MKKIIYIILFQIFFLPATLIFPATTGYTQNPQFLFAGARVSALGILNSGLNGEIQAIFTNPASIGDINQFQANLNSNTLFSNYDNLGISFVLPTKLLNFGFSYGSNTLNSIPETSYQYQRIWQDQTYSAGMRLIQITSAKTLYNILFFQKLSLGTNLKYYQQYIKSYTRGALSFDIGIIAQLNKFSFSGAYINPLSTKFIWPQDTTQSSNIERKLLIGINTKILNDKLTLSINNSFQSITYALEYTLPSDIKLRFSSDLKSYNFGSGLIFKNITAFGKTAYNLRFDYAYTLHSYPMDSNPTHTLSISIFQSILSNKLLKNIIYPHNKTLLNKKTTILKGYAQPSKKILIYNNNKLTRSITSNSTGYWEIPDFKLSEGKNLIFTKSYSLNKDKQTKSQPITLYCDTKLPIITSEIIPNKNQILFKITSNEKLTSLKAIYKTHALKIKKIASHSWYTSIPLQKIDLLHQNQIILQATDKAKNQSPQIKIPFFINLIKPKANQIIYSSFIHFSGTATDKIKWLKINNQKLRISQNHKFSLKLPAKLGKNHYKISYKTTNNILFEKEITIQRLITFADIKNNPLKQTIEILCAKQILFPEQDGNFHPEKRLTLLPSLKIIFKALDITLSPATSTLKAHIQDLTPDNPDLNIVQTAIYRHFMNLDKFGKVNPYSQITKNQLQQIFKSLNQINQLIIPSTSEPASKQDLVLLLKNSKSLSKIN